MNVKGLVNSGLFVLVQKNNTIMFYLFINKSYSQYVKQMFKIGIKYRLETMMIEI